MGGHGGLNILPQKRWNVYNRDNRLKVAQDEAKAKEEEEEAKQRHYRAEQAFRHQKLLRKAGVGDKTDSELVEATGLVTNKQEPLEHINFWREDEIKAEHPEVQKEKRDEKKRRGNAETYTSDAVFDEKFQLGYGLAGAKPWYAQPSMAPRAAGEEQPLVAGPGMLPALAVAHQTHNTNPQLLMGSKQSKHTTTSPRSSETSSTVDSSNSDARHKRRKKSRSSSTKEKAPSKHKKDKHTKTKKDKHKDKKSLAHGSGNFSKGMAQLRAERIARERAEREKARLALIGALDEQGPARDAGGYNSAFGHAAALKKQRLA